MDTTLDPRRLQVHREPPQRDVPYVPTDEPVVAAMLRFAGVCSSDVVYDLGCGDGRIVIAAAKHYGARGVGVDIDPLRIMESRENAQKARVADKVQFLCQSFFDTDFSDATVVMLYLLPSINLKLRPHLLSELRPGTRIIANYFGMGDWNADMQANVHHRLLHQWIVPANVTGAWKCIVNHPAGRYHILLRLRQRQQIVSGSARIGRRDIPLTNGRLFGDQLTFKVADPRFAPHPAAFNCRVEAKHLRGACRINEPGTPSYPWGGSIAHA